MRCIGLIGLLALAAATGAKADDTAVVQAVYRDWMIPRSAELVAESTKLTRAAQEFCAASPQDAASALNEQRRAWNASLVAWARVSTVAIGPMLESRMQSRLDFTPTRPRMIAHAVESAPSDADAMDRIGAPAKGFPAMEWMLWTKPMQPASAECRYAVQIAMEIEREAQAMEKAFRGAATRTLDANAAKSALGEFVNQWVGGLDRLRWTSMVQPVQRAATAERKTSPEFPRGASGATAAGWAAQWATLRALAVGAGPGSFTSMLRERGHGKVADTLAQSVDLAGSGMEGLDTADPDRVMASARTLSELKSFVEGEVAPALGLHIGFSDADGD